MEEQCQVGELVCQLKDVDGVEKEVCECEYDEEKCAEENLMCTIQVNKEGNEELTCVC